MIRWSYPVLALFIFIVIGFGLILTAMEGVETAGMVSPDHNPEEGRLVSHMKNTTHVSGTAAEIHKKMKEAIPYREAQTADFFPTAQNWKEFVKGSIEANLESRHVIVLPSGSMEAL
jgi:hypothetical protein